MCAAKGFVANGLNCGINPVKEKFDLGVVYSETECNAAGVYTPVSYTHLSPFLYLLCIND